MKTRHFTFCAGALAPTRSTTSRCAATLTCRLGQLAVRLALGVTGANAALAQIGTNYCTANPNSTSSPAVMSAWGTTIAVLNDLTVGCASLPPWSFGFFQVSRFQGFVAMPLGSSGNLCLGAPIGRYAGTVHSAFYFGNVDMQVDLTQVPGAGATFAVAAGDTLNFQYWYRDSIGGGATSNFSDGLEVVFTGSGTPIPGMVAIPGATFMMGSNAPSGPPYNGGLFEQPVHQVMISDYFWMGRHEVTQSEYEALMGTNPAFFPGARRPVEQISWNEGRAYCAVLSAQQAINLPVGYEYRLPTEAEWEYACRAGTTTQFHYGQALFCNQARFEYSLHSQSSCGLTPSSGTVAVGSYAPNAFGLYDMHGNVHEWCLDSYAPYTSASVTDPFVTGGLSRVLRGGSWFVNSSFCRSSSRGHYLSGVRANFLGFRIVLAPVLVP